MNLRICLILILLLSGCVNNTQVETNTIENETTAIANKEVLKSENEGNILEEVYEDNQSTVNNQLSSNDAQDNSNNLESKSNGTEMQQDIIEEVTHLINGDAYITVLPDILNVREQPTLNSGVISTIDKEYSYMDRVFTVIEEKTDEDDNIWYKVEYEAEKYGWIASWYTEPTTDILNLRSRVEEFTSLRNEKDNNGLFDFINKHNYIGIEEFEKLVSLYDMLYSDDKIIDITLSGTLYDSRTYSLVYESGIIQQVIVSSGLDKHHNFFENTLKYADTIDWWMNNYIDTLKAEDWEDAVRRSASMWVEQDIIIPEYDENWLSKYKEHFDLNTLDWKLVSLEDGYMYTCAIYGEKDSIYYEHIIHVWTSDGLIGHSDDFVFKDVEFYQFDEE
ncbi:MAG: SH3 domain-containing protein [Vallitalea sp.]|nr:SH3 domain-containing protein [Vallitalea sp.]